MLGVPGGVRDRLGVGAARVALCVAVERGDGGDDEQQGSGASLAAMHHPLPNHVRASDSPVPERDLEGVPMLVRDCVADRVVARVCVDEAVDALVRDTDAARVRVGETGTHAPHVSPGNPGAPGVAGAAMYPTPQVPE